MPFVRRGATYRRGMGATNPCACQDQVAGVPLIAGLPVCVNGVAPGCSQQQQDVPFCSGIPYGQPGYSQCLSQSEQTYETSNPVAAAALRTLIPTVAPTPAAPSNTAPPPVATPSAPAQSNAPNSTTVGPSAPAQSNAPNVSYATPVAASASGCFALFGEEPCIGPIGLYTLLAGAAAGLGLMFAFGGHR